MNTQQVSFDAIRTLCTRREVDLVLASPPTPYTLCLRGQFDGHGDFFSILMQDVEYIELAGGITVGDIMMTTEISAAPQMAQKWDALKSTYSGPAILIRSADSDSWESARPHDLFIVVANNIVCHAGVDWSAAGGR